MKTTKSATKLLLICFSLVCSVTPPESMADEVDFNRDVRPILSDKCFFCHGPDEGDRHADMRLDIRQDALGVIESGDLLDRIHQKDPDLLMPPPESNLKLTESEIQTLKNWIDQGAAYQEHWAFEPLADSIPIPQVKNQTWCRGDLDRFVLSRIEEQSLTPSRSAEPLRWLRRVTLDLTGLPPTPDQIKTFESAMKSHGEVAYEQAVDQLLASPAFGEHMAVAWLDAARYADSYGYQSDKLNTQWPYRDWVIQALNENLPYDDFLTWQLAGDLLPNPTRDQRIATAFNRIHRLNNEGGAVFEEWRLENVADRVHTFGTAMLGLTMECCRCHDHKYDPIPARDYYALSAFFNSIDESGVYDRTEKVPCPSLLLPTETQQRELSEAKARLEKVIADHERALADAKARWEAWIPNETETIAVPDQILGLSFDVKFNDSLKEIYYPSQSDRSWTTMPALVPVTKSPLARMTVDTADDLTDGSELPTRMALPTDGERGVTTKGIEPFDRWMPFSVVVSMRETKRVTERSLIAHHTRGTDCGYNGWDLTIEGGHLESRMARVWPGNAISVRTVQPIPVDCWHQVTATYDGSSRATGLKLYLNGIELKTETIRDELKKSCNVKVDHGGAFVVGQRFRARGFEGGLIDDVRVYKRCLTPQELEFLASGTTSRDDKKPASKPSFGYFVSAVDKTSRESMEKLTEARKAFVMAEEVMNELPVMREMETPRPAHVLKRGEYDAERSDRTLVQRGTLSALPIELPAGTPVDRLALAQWTVHPNHPLTARVAVNRFWGNFFTSPLVRTPENFGSQGDLPTHPKLLDWLARDFVSNGWDVKRLCKQITLSATYSQDSSATPEMLQADPTNDLIARGPAHRLAAEQIRDLALAASGLLNGQRGGPPVSPYQPGEDLWRESNSMSPPFKQSVGQSLHRRSLYSIWKRTAPLPNMMAFDSTSREVCTVKRSRTNTPLQALVLFNDVQFIEAARVMAEGLIASGVDDPVTPAFLKLTGRRPSPKEHAALQQLLHAERDFYLNNPDQASQLLTLGDSPIGDHSPPELAALTNVCQVILNLDATIWKR